MPEIMTIEKFKNQVTSSADFKNNIELAGEENASHEKALQLLEEAEKWLFNIKSNLDQEPLYYRKEKETEKGRQFDHLERELLKAYRKLKMWAEAQRVIDSMLITPHNIKHQSKEGRQAILDKEMKENQ